MVITELRPVEVLAECRRILHLPAVSEPLIDDRLLAALLRRSAGMHCPCSRTTLRASIVEAFSTCPKTGLCLQTVSKRSSKRSL